jgi:hypothetical protein
VFFQWRENQMKNPDYQAINSFTNDEIIREVKSCMQLLEESSKHRYSDVSDFLDCQKHSEYKLSGLEIEFATYIELMEKDDVFKFWSRFIHKDMNC